MIDIQLTGLVKEFEVGQRILDEFTLKIDEGERVGLLGKNGAGKTTIFRIMTGQVDPDEGTVVIAPGKRLGLISQIPVYPDGFTVEDVLETAFGDTAEFDGTCFIMTPVVSRKGVVVPAITDVLNSYPKE